MDLSEQVLRLHSGIRTVRVTRLEAGEWKTINEAIRPGVKFLEDSRERARAMLTLAPALMLGAAKSAGGRAGDPEIAAILYEKVGAIFLPVDSRLECIICLTTERDALFRGHFNRNQFRIT